MWLSHLCQEHSLGIKEMQMYLHEWQAFAKINIYTGHVLPLMNVFVYLLSTHHLFFLNLSSCFICLFTFEGDKHLLQP